MHITALGRIVGADAKAVFRRLQQFNQQRLERARSLLGPRQQLFLDFLPLLLHSNHPSLPGYQSLNCPAGIVHFKPGKEMVERVKRHLSPSFRLPGSTSQPALEAIYLMGSLGSIAHAPSSDIDVWVCHRPELNSKERLDLRAKCDALSAYVASALGLEMHIFLMCAEEFRAGERKALTGEDCGSTQHFLLLDEFYRSAIRLAGKYPLWWLIDPDAHDYGEAVSHLQHRQKRLADQLLDLGNVHAIPEGEYVGAGIWQLFKAIRAPHKSLIKLLLIEAYARQHDRLRPLSEDIRRGIHSGALQQCLDPYLLIYQRLESYLTERHEPERLDLLRRALYFKTELRLSQQRDELSWREQEMRHLIKQWGWGREQLQNLDLRDTWPIHRVRSEHQALVRELTGSYRFLQGFAAEYKADQLISSREMSVLGRKLFAAFERQPDKIDRVDGDLQPALAENTLSFCYFGKADPDTPNWAVIEGRVSLSHWHQTKALREGESLSALICWCLCNGLINSDTRFHLASDHPEHHRGKLEPLISTLKAQLPDHNYAAEAEEHRRFERARRVESITCFVGNASQQGHLDLPIVRHIDVVSVTSWGEVFCKAHTGDHAVAEALHQIADSVISQTEELKLNARPFSTSAEYCTQRFVSDLSALLEFFQRDSGDGDRYIYESGRTYYHFQRKAESLQLSRSGSFTELALLLGKSTHKASRIGVCNRNPRLSALCQVASLQKAGELQVVFQRREEAADIYLLDGHGAIHYQPLLCHDRDIMLTHLTYFLRPIRQHYLGAAPVRWHNLSEQRGKWQLEPFKPENKSDRLRISVKMLGYQGEGQRFDVQINQKTLHFAQYGEDILKHAARYIRELLPHDDALRFCYLSRIEHSSPLNGTPAISEHLANELRLKAQIEEGINSALLVGVD
ncbi:adenylate cyclase class 1 [Litorivivens lipolytica]|uniref:Adenylate cyclase class 1 n=1 Tax=Litorivivens lipolytica TaxID=1524264 RepID=A0A7W4Z6R5_9GAMM|nr:class I adenylate cyclase [Litorivivens lipolytica]MBB3048799.1 adenylate cyclase class 1 [Litorivivens lipolytica]